MKRFFAILLVANATLAHASYSGQEYIFSDIDGIENIRVWNDGRNTYIQSQPGLVIRGATADGGRLTIAGVPNEIRGSINGAKLVITKASARQASTGKIEVTATKSAALNSTSDVAARIAALEASLKAAETKLDKSTANVVTEKSSAEKATDTVAVVESAKIIEPPTPLLLPVQAQSSISDGRESLVQKWAVTVSDKSVRKLLERWSKEAGYQLLWEVPVDLQLGANATVAGTFEEALISVLASLNTSEYPIEAMIYDNRVVRVVKHTARNK